MSLTIERKVTTKMTQEELLKIFLKFLMFQKDEFLKFLMKEMEEVKK